jgi:mono/diheme cytochrome c family protein
MIAFALWMAQAAADPAAIAKGGKLFAESCSVGYCHGVGGAAGRGPRLRGRSFERAYLLSVTRDGVPKSAMPGWKDRLSAADIEAVVSYVMSLTSAEPAAPANPMPPGVGPAAVSAFKGPAQAGRGFAAFFDAQRDTRCATCHALGGRGIAAGPDLSKSASMTPKQLGAAIQATSSTHTSRVRLKGGESFPALQTGASGNVLKLYDLTSPPPVLRSVPRDEIESIGKEPGWSHAPLAKEYAADELADIVSYIYYAGSGRNRPVKAAELK